MDFGSSCINGHEEVLINVYAESKIANANGTLKPSSRLPSLPETSNKQPVVTVDNC